MTSPYLRRRLRSYAEAAAELRPQAPTVDKPGADRPEEPGGRPLRVTAPVEAGDD